MRLRAPRRWQWRWALLAVALLAVVGSAFQARSTDQFEFLQRFRPRKVETGLHGHHLLIFPKETAREVAPVLKRELLRRGWAETGPVLHPSPPGYMMFVGTPVGQRAVITYTLYLQSSTTGSKVGRAKYTSVSGEAAVTILYDPDETWLDRLRNRLGWEARRP